VNSLGLPTLKGPIWSPSITATIPETRSEMYCVRVVG
jgi:hypothetical protein